MNIGAAAYPNIRLSCRFDLRCGGSSSAVAFPMTLRVGRRPQEDHFRLCFIEARNHGDIQYERPGGYHVSLRLLARRL